MSKNNEQDLRVSMGDPRGFQGNGTKASLPLKKKKLKTYLAWLGLSHGTGVFNCSTWDLVPRPGIEPGPLHWERGVLATGPPVKSLVSLFGFGL